MDNNILDYVNASQDKKASLLAKICVDRKGARTQALELINMSMVKYVIAGYEILEKTAEENDIDIIVNKYSSEKNDSIKAIILKASIPLSSNDSLLGELKEKLLELYKSCLKSGDTFILGYAATGYEALTGQRALDEIKVLFEKKEIWLNQMLASIVTKYVKKGSEKEFDLLALGFNDSRYKGRYLLNLIPAFKKALPLKLSQNLYDKIIDAYKHVDIEKTDEDDFLALTKCIAEISADDTSSFEKRIFILRGVSSNSKLKPLFTAILEKSKPANSKNTTPDNLPRREAGRKPNN